jgi:ribonuclease HI
MSYQIVAPRLFSSITSRFPPDLVLYTDGSRCEGTTGFGVYHSENFEMGLRFVERSGVFTSELTAILYALVHIKTHSPGRYIILTDSLSSVYALVSRCS